MHAAPSPDAPPGAGHRTDWPLVRAERLSVRRGGRTILEEVDIAVADGEIVTLIGPNGSGKTTLVRALLGLIKPDSGRVWRHPDLTVGYVPQRLQIDPILPLTVRRLLTLGDRRASASIRAALDETGTGYLIDKSVQDLSGGEFQRVLLARALLREPRLLVLDEPMQGVDFSGQLALFDVIKRVRTRRGCGVLMVSHDLHLVMSGTDQVVCLNTHVCCSGEAESVSRHPAYLQLFGPQAAKGLAVYTHAHDHSHDLAGEVQPLPSSSSGGPEPS